MVMRHVHIEKILAVIACLTMIMPPVGLAGDGTQWGSTPAQTYNREVPALSQSDVSSSTQNPQPDPSTVRQNPLPTPGNDSPLSLPDDKSGGVSPVLTEEEAAKVLDLLSEASSAITNYTQDASSNVNQILDDKRPIAPITRNSGSNPSAGPVQQFANYIVASVQVLREQMAEDSFLPKAESFSAGESPAATRDERAIAPRESNHPAQKDYQVFSSVVLNREMAKTYELLNPPQKLHPFLRWLFYGRHLTQVRAERYLAARAKVQTIFLRAKAGEGVIRYKGKIMGVPLPPLGDENGGAFELVQRM